MKAVCVLALCAFARGETCDDETCSTKEVTVESPSGRSGLMQFARLREHSSIEASDSQSLLELQNSLAEKIESGLSLRPFEVSFLNDIKSWITNTSFPNLDLAHNTDQGFINSSWEAVENCGTDLDDKRDVNTSSWWAAKTASTEAQSDMGACRRTEQTNWNSANSTCTDNLDVFVTGLGSQTPTNVPLDTITRPNAEQWADGVFENWLDETHGWHCDDHNGKTRWLHYQDKANACDSDNEAAKLKKAECDLEQLSFEHKYCDWHRNVVDACDSYSDCRTVKDASYNQTITDTDPYAARRQMEYRILNVIICFIDLLTGPNASKTKAAKEACQNATYDSSHLELFKPTNFPYITLEDTRVCSTSTPNNVEDAPCSSGFATYLSVSSMSGPTTAARSSACGFHCINHSAHAHHNYNNTVQEAICVKTTGKVPNDGVVLALGTDSTYSGCEETCSKDRSCHGFSQSGADDCIFYSSYSTYDDDASGYTAACRTH